jgi:hypothetical protein
MSNRDDFSSRMKEKIARRAAYTCSNPDCRRRTLVPEVSSQIDTIYNGVAAHITAAAPHGPRYDPSLTPEERASSKNGIHLCRLCANQVDANKGKDYPAHVLREWKMRHDSWLIEQQKYHAEQRREYSKVSTYFIEENAYYDFVPEERSSGYIILPEDNSDITSRFTSVKGRIDKMLVESTYWIAISPQSSFDLWWPQSQCVLVADGFWKVENTALGRAGVDGEKDIGRKFDIGLYETLTDACEIFQEAAHADRGIRKPEGAFLLWKIAVTRTL